MSARLPTLAVLAALLLLPSCERASREEAKTWRADCEPVARPAPLSLEAARAAHRFAERRQAVKVREAAAPGYLLRELHAALDTERVADGEICLAELAEVGQLLFEHEYGFADGLGGGGAAVNGASPFRRVHGGLFGGPETVACTSCHWLGGPNGAGAETDNAFLAGDGEVIASGDARNPQALVALGVVQALAREMSRDLARQRDALVHEAAKGGATREARLVTKGIDFGALRATPKGEIDASELDGVDADLTIKPFGWKGTLADLDDFSAEALQVHIGIQSDELFGFASHELLGDGADAADPDGDGVRRELGRGPLAAMLVHLSLLELPVIDPLIQSRNLEAAATGLFPPTTTSFVEDFHNGRREFHALGCASCHVPTLVLENPLVTIAGLPPIDLSKEMRAPALSYDAELGGYPVWPFSDFKRHDMGERNVARHVQRGVAEGEYLTPRLWGVADSAPYLHDGRAPSFDYAIAGHDGEGAVARDAYAELDPEEKGWLRVYLMSLRRAPRVIVP